MKPDADEKSHSNTHSLPAGSLRTVAERMIHADCPKQKIPWESLHAYNRYSVDRELFEKLVEQAFERLPQVFRAKLTNVAIIVEDRPPQEPERGSLLLGLFHGVPRTEKSVFQSTPPDRIFLYQKNIEAVCSSDEEIRRQVRSTLLHELGHYFGLSEDELREI